MGATPIHARAIAAKHRWRIDPSAVLLVSDAFLLVASGLAAVFIGTPAPHDPLAWACGYALLCLAVLRARGFYRFRLEASVVGETGRIVSATALAAMTVISARSLLVGGGHVGLLGARLWLYSTVFLSAGRAGIAIAARRRWSRTMAVHPTVIIGAGNVGRLIARRLRDRPGLGLRPIGHIDDEPRPGSDGDLPVLGGTAELRSVISAHQVSHVIISFSLLSDATMQKLMRLCRELGTEVLIVPRLYEEMTQRLTIEHLGAIPLIRAERPDPAGWQFAVKYALDRLAALLLIIVLLPLLGIIAAFVKLSSRGPILFRQKRVGLDGKVFTMLKFRSMRGEPDEVGEADAKWAAAIRGEPIDEIPELLDRTTGIGRILRGHSLDELPQLFSVLRGEMSLVGPRPERVNYANDFESLVYRYGDRFRVRSGITGWAQVQNLRGETSLSDRVEWDNFYIENWSLWLDMKILFMTFAAVRNTRPRAAEAHQEGDTRLPRVIR